RLERAQFPWGRVNDVADVMSHPQLSDNGLVSKVDSPAGPIPVVGAAFVVGGTRPDPGAVPALGEHTDEVFAEIGIAPP
ncbi:MAG: CoA transferase, partial [Actinobacteria bacterium]|nr:CoA transferase [Actinomycetota bacterium]